MEGFDTLTMSYLATPMPLSSVSTMDGLPTSMLPLEALDQHSNFDAETFVGSDDATFGHHALHPPSIHRFSGAYDDPFSDALNPVEQTSQHDQNGLDNPSIERGDKLLSFSPPKYNYALLDYTCRRTSVSLSAQLHGMFFLAESPWPSAGDISATPTELTCYRRNLFQITGTLTLPRTLQYVLMDSGDQIPILSQELAIYATESVEGNGVKIISVPWKTPANNTSAIEEKTEKEPPPITLDLSQGQDLDSDFVSFPIAWKRLQFRVATANNGRRKELQQHFVVKIRLVAILATGEKVPLCEIHSGAIIVRGRSPRNFQSRKDMPISGIGTNLRKNSQNSAQTAKTSAPEFHPKSQSKLAKLDVKSAGEAQQPSMNYGATDPQISSDILDWRAAGGQTDALTTVQAPQDAISYQQPGSIPYAQSSPDLSRAHRSNQFQTAAPITLSLTEDEPKKPPSPSDGSRKVSKLTPLRPPSFSLNILSSPDESADLLYEYFPLGLDDWMPPVDAVYRPHVVHHTNLPQDPKAIAVKNRSKRYFSEDQS